MPFAIVPKTGDGPARGVGANESDAWSNAVAFARLRRYTAGCLRTGLRSSEQPSVECRT